MSELKLQWQEHFNGLWASENCEYMATREGTQALYERLVIAKETIHFNVPTSFQQNVQLLPDFEIEKASVRELDSHISNLLVEQVDLAQKICAELSYMEILDKRLVILKRIFHAIRSKYHNKDQIETKNQNNKSVKETGREQCLDLPGSGNSMLLELGLRTGLSVVFALLNQNWQNCMALGVPSLCNEVLTTAIEVVSELPPLSLANDNQISSCGIRTLCEVSKFLKKAVLPTSGADERGKMLCTELLLGLALQRGSLRYLLDWIQMALDASGIYFKNCSKTFKNIKHFVF